MVDFSLRSNLTNINFITIDDGFRFFSCSAHTRYADEDYMIIRHEVIPGFKMIKNVDSDDLLTH